MSRLKYQPVSAIPDAHGRISPTPGMTLRQHYAGLAMQGYLSSDDSDEYTAEGLAQMAVKAADALLAELEK